MAEVNRQKSGSSVENIGGGLNERCEMLDRTKWAQALSWDELKTFVKYMDAIKIKKGNELFREGDRDAHLYIIGEGKIEIRKSDGKMQIKTIATAGPGHTLGELSLIDGWPRSASALAKEDAVVFMLSKENFQRLTVEVPSLAVKVILRIAHEMSQRLRHASGVLVDYLKSN